MHYRGPKDLAVKFIAHWKLTTLEVFSINPVLIILQDNI